MQISERSAAGLFIKHIAYPLIHSPERKYRERFDELWHKLPEHFRKKYSTVSIEFINKGGKTVASSFANRVSRDGREEPGIGL